MPRLSSLPSVLPKPAAKRTPAIRSASSALRSFDTAAETQPALSREVACSTASFWVKWTT